jgi:tetratricopeptide (TPR) repeat protein
MNNNSAQQLLEQAIELKEQGRFDASIEVYQQVISLEPEWHVPYYNLGLFYKYQCNWQLSYQHNQKAVELDPSNEAAWWNLGIAATVLLDWRTAREAWNYFGLNLEVSDEELTMDLGNVPIRLNPDSDGEVVWCKRIDPARAVIYNVPLAICGHRYGDTVLNDGAPQGYRISNGKEIPVFNELQLLTKSAYKTYSITIHTENQEDIDKLEELCDNAKIEFEDWSTVRMLCKQCSEGTPHETHDNDLKVENEDKHNIGFASVTEDAIKQVLTTWRAITLCGHTGLKLELE